ncbi:MAG: FAD-dependent oxidoreductase, partial [Firmicutes bacterium]|nr:FAD-dependent oxidoreductase [Bacillota bacterium]
FQLGKIKLKNRIVFLPHLHQYAENHMPSEREAYYYAERAKGGVALCVYGCQAVWPGSTFGGDVYASDERVIPGYRKISSMVHDAGGFIFTQLTQYGNQAPRGLTLNLEEWKPQLAPSQVIDGFFHDIPKEMEQEEIKELVKAYAKGAYNAKEGGMDGTEIKVAHDGIIRQFLSPQYNRRTDEYGGSPEKRARFLLEVIKAIRDAVGPDFGFGVRLCLDEMIPGGYNLEDCKDIAKIIAGTGMVDYISTDIGTFASVHMCNPSMYIPLGYALYASAAIKEAVPEIPLIAFGRINDPIQAEKLLADGQADLVGMARGLIADSQWANKAKENRIDDIRKCMGCNQGCIRRVWNGQQITCAQNPAAGREKELGLGTLKEASVKKKVMVVGGGPAGMKAAEIAARRGHKVTLYEKGANLGGQVSVFTKAPFRQEFSECIRWLESQINKLGVEIKLNTCVDANLVLSEKPDAVIVATGSRPAMNGSPDFPQIPGSDQENVISALDVFLETEKVGDNVVVFETQHDWRAPLIAQYLASQDKKVRILSTGFYVGSEIANDFASLVPTYQQLFELGVEMTPLHVIKAIEGSNVTIANAFTGAEQVLEDIDTVVLAVGHYSDDKLYKELKGKVKELHRVGDCVAPARLEHVILEGELAGRSV